MVGGRLLDLDVRQAERLGEEAQQRVLAEPVGRQHGFFERLPLRQRRAGPLRGFGAEQAGVREVGDEGVHAGRSQGSGVGID